MIHLGPPILCASLRHVAVADEEMSRAPGDFLSLSLFLSFFFLPFPSGARCRLGAKLALSSVFSLPLVALATYLLWQLIYFVIVAVFRKKVIEQRNYPTSFSYLVKSQRKKPGLISKICSVFGSRYRFAVFMFLQFVYATVTILPTKLLWDYPALHELFLGAMTTISVWNAANFYIEIFSIRYATEVGHPGTANTEKRHSFSKEKAEEETVASAGS
jgi:hypothetical protein